MREWEDDTLVAIQSVANGFKVLELPARDRKIITTRRTFHTEDQAERYIQDQYPDIQVMPVEDVEEEAKRRRWNWYVDALQLKLDEAGKLSFTFSDGSRVVLWDRLITASRKYMIGVWKYAAKQPASSLLRTKFVEVLQAVSSVAYLTPDTAPLEGWKVETPQENPYEGLDGYHNAIGGLSCPFCNDFGCRMCLNEQDLYM